MSDDWYASFQQFMKDLGPRPIGMTVERRDNDGNYCATNCHWATRSTQARNRRTNVWVDVWGGRMVFQDAMDTLNINHSTAFALIANGRSHQEAIDFYIRKRGLNTPAKNLREAATSRLQ